MPVSKHAQLYRRQKLLNPDISAETEVIIIGPLMLNCKAYYVWYKNA